MSVLQNAIAAASGSAGPAAYQVERSLRFNSADSAHLTWTPPQVGNRTTWTWRGWVKRSGITVSGTNVYLFDAGPTNQECPIAFNTSDQIEIWQWNGSAYDFRLITTQVFRDPGAWLDIQVAVDTTQATAANRVKLWVNGVQVTAFGTSTYPSQNLNTLVNSVNTHAIGKAANSAQRYFPGYLTEVHFIDGQALDPTSFGETSASTGVWMPKAYEGSYGNNGFYLPFNDNSTVLNLGRNRQTLTADPYFPVTTLLLNGNQPSGVTDTNNIVFKDSSPNNFSITRNGNTTQGTFSPFSQTGWGVYNTGSSSYCQLNNSDYSISTGDFTIEFWMFVTSDKATTCFASATSNPNLTVAMGSGSSGARQPYLEYGGAGTFFTAFSNYLNTWTHVAFVRSGGTCTVYQNGTALSSASKSAAVGSTANLYLLRNSGDTGQDFPGYISNFRICKSAVYTGNFTPSTSALTTTSQSATNCVLLTFQSNRFIDNSSTAATVTPTATSVQAFSPFTPTAAYSAATHGGSGYFDGNGDYVSIANQTALQMGTGDFQVEAWAYVTNSSAFQSIICIGVSTGGSTAGTFTFRVQSDLKVRWCINDNSTGLTSTNAITANAWVHLCASRVSGTLRIFINGVENGSLSDSTNYNNTSGTMIGAENQGGATNYFYGYISGLRVIKGSGVTSITVPTAPPTAITNTSALLNYTNGGIIDATGKNVLETVGNAQISTTQSKWGGASMSFDGTGDYLIGVTGEATKFPGDFTIEGWINIPSLPAVSTATVVLATQTSHANATGLMFGPFGNAGAIGVFTNNAWTTYSSNPITANTWWHIAVVRLGTTVSVYTNGILTGSFTSSQNFSDGGIVVGNSRAFNNAFTGYIDDLRISKFARYTGSFSVPTAQFAYNQGDINVKQWVPNNFSVTAGTGNDSLVDSPTNYGTDTGAGGEVRGNYCTINPLTASFTSSVTFSDGNLCMTKAASTIDFRAIGTMAYPSTGKWYYEFTLTAINASTSNQMYVGIADFVSATTTGFGAYFTNGYFYLDENGNKSTQAAGTGAAYGATWAVNDVIGVAYDADNGTITFYKNGVSQGTAYTGISSSTTWYPAFTQIGGSSSSTSYLNFGQRPFAYTAPSGFKALCTQNLPTPAIGATSSTLASKNFNVKAYTGNGTTNAQTGVGFQPDFLWFKIRSGAANHVLINAITGKNNFLGSNTTNAEATATDQLLSFDSDGFTVGANTTGGNVNVNSSTYVAWAWKANGAGVSNTAGTISSTVSANTTAGISVVTYTGNGTTGATIGHGLGVTPAFIIIKKRSATGNWQCWHKTFSGTQYISLNLTNAVTTLSSVYNATPTSSVFQLGNDTDVNANGSTYVAYCFAEVPGFSKFGSYTGNGAADGAFVYCGFRPRYVLIKSTGIESWGIWDSARDTYNFVQDFLLAQSSNAEQAGPQGVDLLSNGFKVRGNYPLNNSSGQSYIFMAFAEAPFQYSRAR